jgi:hypothetical protein
MPLLPLFFLVAFLTTGSHGVSEEDPLLDFEWNIFEESQFPISDKEMKIMLRYDARVSDVTEVYLRSLNDRESIPRAIRRAMGKLNITDDPHLSEAERRFVALFLPQLR